MKKYIFTIILLLVTFSLFSQDIIEKKSTAKPNYSENSEIEVIYKDRLDKFHSKKYSSAIFVNDIFVGDKSILDAVNAEKIESLKIEKENFKKNGIEYYGKILVKMNEDYIPKFISLSELSNKYLELDKNPMVFQVNDNFIAEDYRKYLVDENYILHIIVNNIQTSEKGIEINLIQLTTKTTENLKEANVIRIKGTEL